MIWLIKFLIFGPQNKQKCQHIWDIKESLITSTDVLSSTGEKKGEIIDGYKYVLICKNCGDLTGRTITF